MATLPAQPDRGAVSAVGVMSDKALTDIACLLIIFQTYISG